MKEGEDGTKAHIATFSSYLWSIVYMPSSLRVLCLTNLFCWMSLVCYSLYFTDFVGEAVFGGDPGVSVAPFPWAPMFRDAFPDLNFSGKPRNGRSKVIRRGRQVRLLGNGHVLVFVLLLLIHYRAIGQTIQVRRAIFLQFITAPIKINLTLGLNRFTSAASWSTAWGWCSWR